MTSFIELPFFKNRNGKILYLDQYEVLDIVDVPIRLADKLLIDEGVRINLPKISKSKRSHTRILAIEPHPDDCVLSCGGYLLDTIRKGGSCTVFNIFSKTALSNWPWNKKIEITEPELEEIRLAESRIAIETFLGQDFDTLKFRTAKLRGNKSNFAPRHSEPKLVSDLVRVLKYKIDAGGFTTVLCPLGIGGHIDHLIVFDAVTQLYKENTKRFKLIFYQEYPYSRSYGLVNKRMPQIRKQFKLKPPLFLDVNPYINQICDLISIYRSQFDDINRKQMLAVIKEDFRAIGAEKEYPGSKGHIEYMQKYYEIDRVL